MKKLLGDYLYNAIIGDFSLSGILEIRIRLNRAVILRTLNDIHVTGIVADRDMINTIVLNAARNSLYAYETEISQGYIPYENGIRIGLTGKGNVSENGKLAYKSFYSLCIRIPHQIFGLKRELEPLIENFDNTLIISPPGCGKTTLCRELARILSNSFDTLVIDERYEIFGENLDLKTGLRCDIVSGLKKSDVYGNIIRTMSPQLVVCDELAGEEDTQALAAIARSGIKCLATFHAKKVTDVPKNLQKLFSNFIVLNSTPAPGNICSITRKV